MPPTGTGQPLTGIRVFDLTHYIVGPFYTKLLADHGADMIKVERPGTGDIARQLSPFQGGVPHPERSAYFLYLNTNKRGVTLNLKNRFSLLVSVDGAPPAHHEPTRSTILEGESCSTRMGGRLRCVRW